ncbi:MAG: hypothetical protein LBR76_00690 [Oscillospiraceae bacterium]|nr:hypothetical protein [Oscillospiraceae bacterium]
MVKGLSRRVVMVRYPEAGVFEQALFVVRDDAASLRGITADDVVAEACRISQNHAHRRARKNLPPLAYTAIGGAAVGLAWALSFILG